MTYFIACQKQCKSSTNHLCFVCFMEESKAGLERHEYMTFLGLDKLLKPAVTNPLHNLQQKSLKSNDEIEIDEF